MQGLCYSYGGDKTKRRKLNSGLEPRVGLKNINAGQVGLQELLLQELTTHDLTSLEPFYATDIQYHQYQHYQNIYNQNTRKVVRLTEPDNGPAILLASREKHYCSEQVLDVARMPSGDGKAQLVFIGDAPVTDNPAGKKRKFDESHLETLAVALHTIDDHRRAVCSTDELDVQVTSHSGNSVAIELQRSDSQLSNIFNQIAQLPIDDSGIAPEEIQSYIGEQDPLTHKWSCLFPDCDKEFGRRENIRSHIQTHLGDRQYRCSSCGKRFVRQHDLKRHSKIHTGDKPHKCPCSAGFARQDALTRHRQRGVCIGGFPNAMRRQARRGRPRKKRLSSGETVEGIDRSYETSARIKSNGHQRLLSDFSGTMSFSDPLDDCLTLGFDENAFDSYSRLIHSDDVFET